VSKLQLTETVKNGRRKERQSHMCKHCGRQFLESYRPWRYSDDVRQLCIKMYLNGMGLRGIERVTNIHHTTVMHWIRMLGMNSRMRPRRMKFQKLLTWMNCKRLWAKATKNLALTAANHWRSGILAWVVGDRCGNVQALVVDCQVLAELLVWSAMAIRFIQCSLKTIPISSKTYMTRIEGENTGCVTIWHDCTARRCATKSIEMLECSLRCCTI